MILKKKIQGGGSENNVFDIDLDAKLKEMDYDSDESSESIKSNNKPTNKTSKASSKVSKKELSMNGRREIETLQKGFKKKFSYLTLVFLDKDRRATDISKSLTDIRQAKKRI